MSATERRLTFARRAPTERPSAWRIGTASASAALDRKSTRLNSSHDQISYAVFCLKKKKKIFNIANNSNESADHLRFILSRYDMRRTPDAARLLDAMTESIQTPPERAGTIPSQQTN